MGATCLYVVRPDLGSFRRLDELGLQVVGQRLEPGRAVLACRIVETDEFGRWCRRCGCEAAPRDSVTDAQVHATLAVAAALGAGSSSQALTDSAFGDVTPVSAREGLDPPPPGGRRRPRH